MPKIIPTVGRVVLYKPDPDEPDLRPDSNGRCAAIVVYVHNEQMVNLAVFDGDGRVHPKSSVRLIQDGETPEQAGYYCHWMGYQLGQAAKTEAAEAALAKS